VLLFEVAPHGRRSPRQPPLAQDRQQPLPHIRLELGQRVGGAAVGEPLGRRPQHLSRRMQYRRIGLLARPEADGAGHAPRDQARLDRRELDHAVGRHDPPHALPLGRPRLLDDRLGGDEALHAHAQLRRGHGGEEPRREALDPAAADDPGLRERLDRGA
jgi:hypothetical protein